MKKNFMKKLASFSLALTVGITSMPVCSADTKPESKKADVQTQQKQEVATPKKSISKDNTTSKNSNLLGVIGPIVNYSAICCSALLALWHQKKFAKLEAANKQPSANDYSNLQNKLNQIEKDLNSLSSTTNNQTANYVTSSDYSKLFEDLKALRSRINDYVNISDFEKLFTDFKTLNGTVTKLPNATVIGTKLNNLGKQIKATNSNCVNSTDFNKLLKDVQALNATVTKLVGNKRGWL